MAVTRLKDSATGLAAAMTKLAYTAEVECEPLKLVPGATASCTISGRSEESVAVKATFDDGVTLDFVNDAVILPAVVTSAIGEMPLTCAKRVAKRDEKVRFSLVANHTPQDVDVSVNAAGTSAFSPVS